MKETNACVKLCLCFWLVSRISSQVFKADKSQLNCYTVIRAEADGLRTETWVIADNLGSVVCSTQLGYFQVQSANPSCTPFKKR